MIKIKTKNKKYLFFVLAVSAIAILAGVILLFLLTREKEFVPPENLKQIYNSRYGFTLNYNDEWQVEEDEIFNLTLTNTDGTVLTTSIQGVDEELSLDSILRSRVALLETKEDLESQIDEKETKINGHSYKTILITIKNSAQEDDSSSTKIKSYATLLGKKQYMVVSIAYDDEDSFKKGEEIVKTLRFD